MATTLTPTLDRFKHLLLRNEIVIGNLSDSDMGIIVITAALAIPRHSTNTEKEITERLGRWLSTVGSNLQTDAVELRRYLVDSRCLRRDPAGRAYTRPDDWPSKRKDIAAELESVDVEQFAEQVRTDEAERRAARKKAAMEKKDAVE